VVVPVYNEAATIQRACAEIANAVERYPGRARVIAVDDGSVDDSAAIMERLSDRLEVLEVVRHEENSGYGAALRTGARRAQDLGLDFVAFMDSDLTNPPSDLLKIGKLLEAGNEYVKGSRFVEGGGMSAVPASRRVISRVGNMVARPLFGTGVRDVTNGFRAVRTDLFLSWPLGERDFAVIVEELDWALRSGLEPAELPTVLTARTGEQRATAFSYSPRLVLSYLRYPLRAAGRRLRGRSRG
jgi:glycosyltransferase involved in cell wall biosynthesis